MTFDEADRLCGKARIAIRVRKDPEAARVLVEGVYAQLASLEAPPTELADIYATLANTFQDLGDDRAGPMIARAIEIESTVEPARPVILGTHQLFYANWLLTHERWADAERLAFDGARTYAQGTSEADPELERVRFDAAQMIVKARAGASL
jgi:hypothetical protein